ncbi:mediator complex subunit Med5-domain-containing protein [Hysterangium stoloniferum]|nr:mediator complex subunit Med5-domain-containing protein [Hysterangium stoloniferum]
MSSDISKVEQLTKTAYLSGFSAAEWREVFKSLSREAQLPDDLVASSICELLSSFHGDTTLRDYLRTAVVDPQIPLHLWQLLPAFLKNVRSPTSSLHDPSSLDMVCRLILNLHYESHAPALGSLIPFAEHPSELLNTISDLLYLLRLSYEFSASPFHQLTTSASELLLQLLAYVGDMSDVTTSQATVLLSLVHVVLQVVTLDENVRNALDSFLLSLSLILGDGTRQADEAEMFASFQLTPSRHETAGPNPSLDLLSGSLIMARLVSNRGTQSGSGCQPIAIANLMAWYRVSSQALGVFYAHAILAALSCLSQIPSEADATPNFVWRSFTLARLPLFFQKFQERLASEGGVEVDHTDTSIMQSAIAQVFTHHELLDQCEHKMRNAGANNGDAIEDDTKGSSFRFELLGALVSTRLLDHTFALELFPSLPTDFPTKLTMETQESGSDLDTYLDSKFSSDSSLEDTLALFDRITPDYRSHTALADMMHGRFVHACRIADIETLGRLCKILSEHEHTLEIIALHAPLHEMIAHALACLEDYDLIIVGDPQTAVTHIGEVVLFLQSVLARFRITSSVFRVDDRVLRSDGLRSTSVVFPYGTLSEDDRVTINAWRKAIFDHDSEGIDDEILRSTKPRTLLRLSATLFSEAILACIAQRIDADALQNGVSYYMGPLLNWTLVGVVQALLEELERASPRHFTVLQAVLSDKSCPSVVLRTSKQTILRLSSDSRACARAQTQAPSPLPSMATLVDIVMKDHDRSLFQTSKEPAPWMSQPKLMIRQALVTATSGRVPYFDIERCLAMTNVRAFFESAWRELLAAASIGKMETCRRLATYILSPTSGMATESTTSVPPLLPIFLHAYVPFLLVSIDNQITSEQNISVQLLSTIVVSALTFAANFERALMKPAEVIAGRDIKVQVHNSPCSAMARRLRLDLRKVKGPSALALFQKLSASSTFVSTFPTI